VSTALIVSRTLGHELAGPAMDFVTKQAGGGRIRWVVLPYQLAA
jgi:hypothetical protein